MRVWQCLQCGPPFLAGRLGVVTSAPVRHRCRGFAGGCSTGVIVLHLPMHMRGWAPGTSPVLAAQPPALVSLAGHRSPLVCCRTPAHPWVCLRTHPVELIPCAVAYQAAAAEHPSYLPAPFRTTVQGLRRRGQLQQACSRFVCCVCCGWSAPSGGPHAPACAHGTCAWLKKHWQLLPAFAGGPTCLNSCVQGLDCEGVHADVSLVVICRWCMHTLLVLDLVQVGFRHVVAGMLAAGVVQGLGVGIGMLACQSMGSRFVGLSPGSRQQGPI